MPEPTDKTPPDQNLSDDEVLTTQQVADWLHMTTATVRELATKGKIPGGRFGNEWRFLHSEIDKMLRGEGHNA